MRDIRRSAKRLPLPASRLTMFLQCGKFRLSLSRPLIMGVVNLTPDSFSDGGQFADTQSALAHAWRLIAEGADIIDIGGESTRPGAAIVALDEERRRVLTVLEQLAAGPVPVSVDTQKPELMHEAITAGAAMINDINALQAVGAVEAITASGVAVCLMHKQGRPADMQHNPHYDDVVAEVIAFLSRRVQILRAAGVAAERIVIDPGFGFGKTLEHNLELIRKLDRFSSAGALIAAQKGAQILRVHDVAATRDALAVWAAIKEE